MSYEVIKAIFSVRKQGSLHYQAHHLTPVTGVHRCTHLCKKVIVISRFISSSTKDIKNEGTYILLKSEQN